MINAVLYSDQVMPEHEKIDARLLQMMEGRVRRIGYVPSAPEPDHKFFLQKKAYYARRGLDLALFHDWDRVQSWAETDALLACDAIHLSGGNTGAFLTRLRRNGMLGKLRDWAQNGGLIIGTSTGAILMTPTIAVDALFNGKHPRHLEEDAALDLVPFEFFPHIAAKPTFLPDLIAYSRCNHRPVIACPDGDGIAIVNGMAECIGDLLWLSGGSIERAGGRRFSVEGEHKELWGNSIAYHLGPH